MLPLSFVDPKGEQQYRFNIQAEAKEQFRRVTLALFHLWQDQPDLSWDEVLEAVAAKPVPGWYDERTKWLVRRMVEPTPPTSVRDLQGRLDQIVRDATQALPPEGVRFEGGAQWFNRVFPVSTQIAVDASDRFLISAPEVAAHPTTLLVPSAGEAGATVLDAAEAVREATEERLISFAAGHASIAGQSVPLVTAPLRFRYVRTRFVNGRTGEPVVVRGRPVELLSSLHISVNQSEMRCAAFVGHAELAFEITMSARSDGVARAKVTWRLECVFPDSLEVGDLISTSKLSIDRGDRDHWAFTSESKDIKL